MDLRNDAFFLEIRNVVPRFRYLFPHPTYRFENACRITEFRVVS